MPINNREDMSELEQNCNETWHRWRNVWPNPLPWWKRLIGYELESCEKCGKERKIINYEPE